MTRSLRHLGLLLSGTAVLSALVLAAPRPAEAVGGSSTPCFQVRVEYLGRTPVQNIGGVQYYRWNYRIYGDGCVNRGLSHWVLGLCAATQQGLTQVSTQSVDNSDPSGGMITNYMYEIGKDPTTGISGLKWNYVSGNAIDKAAEYDDFSFVATGDPTPTAWTAKGATIVTSGTVLGPGCSPVPTEQATWGSVKTLFR
jgi:hypothetical protein